MKHVFTLLVGIILSGITCAQCGGVFFSEYIEGSSSNKAFEVYNNTGSSIDLTDYVIYRFNNGSTTATDSLFPQGTLTFGSVWVIGNPAANVTIQALSDTLHSITFYNGDDALIIRQISTGDTLDIIGEVGVDPGSGWTVGTGATNNFTLVRQQPITEGETDWSIGVSQWDVFPIDMTDSLGTHNGAATSIIVDFTQSTAGLTASFTDASAGATSWLWDFGDGNTSTMQNPSHSYAVPGTYTVCLTATNTCGTDSSCQVVTVTCPAPATDFSSSAASLTASFTDLTTGSPSSWLWDFGDGNTSTMQNPSHSYAVPGTYTVCLTATNTCGTDSSCQVITVTCPAPGTDFSSSASSLAASFTDLTTGSPISWLWDFGDGNTSTMQNPSHSYSTPGSYTVCLTTTNSCGSDSACQVLTVTCPTPTSDFSSSTAAQTATFTDASAGTPTSWLWDFGDGNTSTMQNPSHTYSAPGTYLVCLTVTNTCGSDSSCQSVTVVTTSLVESGFAELKLYPNPTSDQAMLDLGATYSNVEVEINDVNGNLVSRKVLANGQTTMLEVAQLEPGVYFVSLKSGQNLSVLKLIRQ